MKKIIEIANLEIDCKIGKDRHFIAADRKNKWRISLGLFAVIGSAIISSGIGASILKLIGTYLENETSWESLATVLGHVLPLSVGISTSIIGFLGLEKQTAQHRFVGNAYIEIARKTRSLLNSINENNFEESVLEYKKLLDKYLEINKEGESCPTNDKDSYKAMSMNAKKRMQIKGKISEFEKEGLGIIDKPKKERKSFKSIMSKGIKFRIANFFVSIKLIRVSDYRKYLRSLS